MTIVFRGLVLLCACMPLTAGSPALKVLEAKIRALTAGQKATYGIAFENFASGETLLINAYDMMHAASTMKVPLMMRLFEMMDRENVQPDATLKVKNSFKSIVDGSAYQITVDSEESLYQKLDEPVPLMQLIEAMIIHSSNLATNMLIQDVRAGRVNDLMRRLGAADIQVLRGVEDLKAYEKNLNNQCHARDMLTIMKALATSPEFRPESRAQMLAILRKQAFNDMIPAGIPAAAKALVGHKTGAISRVQHDAAIVDLPDGTRYGLVIFARDFENQRPLVKETARKISRQVYNFVTR